MRGTINQKRPIFLYTKERKEKKRKGQEFHLKKEILDATAGQSSRVDFFSFVLFLNRYYISLDTGSQIPVTFKLIFLFGALHKQVLLKQSPDSKLLIWCTSLWRVLINCFLHNPFQRHMYIISPFFIVSRVKLRDKSLPR